MLNRKECAYFYVQLMLDRTTHIHVHMYMHMYMYILLGRGLCTPIYTQGTNCTCTEQLAETN